MARTVNALVLLLLLAACDRESDREAPRIDELRKPIDCVTEWTPAAEGIDYRMLNCSATGFDLHLVRVDPKRARIDAVVRPGSMAADLGREFTFAINANFFDETDRPLGVVLSQGRLLNRPHPVSWQSVFYVDEDGRPGIVPMKAWARARRTAFNAAQCGPRLVIDGQRNQVARAQPTWRSGVCIDRGKQVVFFATPPDAQFDVMQMVELAAKDLECRDAMLFDGGPSTQLYLRRDGKPVSVEGGTHVPAYVVVTAGKR